MTEIWASNSFDKICNDFFIDHCHNKKENSHELKYIVFRPKFCWDYSIRFEKEIIFEKCSRNFLRSAFQICEILL